MTTTYVGVGSNIEREFNARLAITELSALGRNMIVSTVYDCASVDFDSSPFFNFVVQMDTHLDLTLFSQALRNIEIKSGRKEDAQKFQDRALDLDIILFGDIVSVESPQIPRDDIYRYPFVIQPLYELCPDLVIPNDGRMIKDIWLNMSNLESLTKVDFQFDGC